MKIHNKQDREFLRLVVSGDTSYTDEQLAEIYVPHKGEYILRNKEWKRSMVQRINWRKYRFNYITGIHRYFRNVQNRTKMYRLGMFKLLSKSVQRLMSQPKKKKDKDEEIQEQYMLNLNEYDRYEFLYHLNTLRAKLFNEASYYVPQEDDHTDYIAFVDHLSEACHRIEQALIKDKLIYTSDLEMLLLLVNDEIEECWKQIYGKTFMLKEDEGYADVFFRLQRNVDEIIFDGIEEKV